MQAPPPHPPPIVVPPHPNKRRLSDDNCPLYGSTPASSAAASPLMSLATGEEGVGPPAVTFGGWGSSSPAESAATDGQQQGPFHSLERPPASALLTNFQRLGVSTADATTQQECKRARVSPWPRIDSPIDSPIDVDISSPSACEDPRMSGEHEAFSFRLSPYVARRSPSDLERLSPVSQLLLCGRPGLLQRHLAALRQAGAAISMPASRTMSSTGLSNGGEDEGEEGEEGDEDDEEAAAAAAAAATAAAAAAAAGIGARTLTGAGASEQRQDGPPPSLLAPPPALLGGESGLGGGSGLGAGGGLGDATGSVELELGALSPQFDARPPRPPPALAGVLTEHHAPALTPIPSRRFVRRRELGGAELSHASGESESEPHAGLMPLLSSPEMRGHGLRRTGGLANCLTGVPVWAAGRGGSASGGRPERCETPSPNRPSSAMLSPTVAGSSTLRGSPKPSRFL